MCYFDVVNLIKLPAYSQIRVGCKPSLICMLSRFDGVKNDTSFKTSCAHSHCHQSRRSFLISSVAATQTATTALPCFLMQSSNVSPTLIVDKSAQADLTFFNAANCMVIKSILPTLAIWLRVIPIPRRQPLIIRAKKLYVTQVTASFPML